MTTRKITLGFFNSNMEAYKAYKAKKAYFKRLYKGYETKLVKEHNGCFKVQLIKKTLLDRIFGLFGFVL